MSAHLAPEHTPGAPLQVAAAPGVVHVYDLHTGEPLAIHETAARDPIRDELKRVKARLVERTALVVVCEAALADVRDALDDAHPADRFLRLRLEAVLRRIAAEVAS